MQFSLNSSDDLNLLVKLLHDADEDDERIRAAVSNPLNTVYLAVLEGQSMGAALMHWHSNESELIYIAVEEGYQGQGWGKEMIAALLAEASQRGVKSVVVGTANASLENIAFYQKCGFRMDSVRKDYFSYFKAPVYANGIMIRDMLVLRYDVLPADQP